MPPEWIHFLFSRYGAAVGVSVVAFAIAGFSTWQLRAMRATLENHTETDDQMMDGFRGTMTDIRDTMREIRDDNRRDQEHAQNSRAKQYEKLDNLGQRLSTIEGRLGGGTAT